MLPVLRKIIKSKITSGDKWNNLQEWFKILSVITMKLILNKQLHWKYSNFLKKNGGYRNKYQILRKKDGCML